MKEPLTHVVDSEELLLGGFRAVQKIMKSRGIEVPEEAKDAFMAGALWVITIMTESTDAHCEVVIPLIAREAFKWSRDARVAFEYRPVYVPPNSTRSQ